MSYEYFTIQFKHGGWNVYGWDKHPSGSVYAYQPRKTFLKSFDRCLDAQSTYPTAQFSNVLLEPQPTIGQQPADWYGPEGGFSLCGEHWDEDDEVVPMNPNGLHGFNDSKGG